jgi:hypothetical protein
MGKERGRLSLVVKILGIAAVLLIVLMLLIPLFVDANQFRPMLNAQLSDALGREVKVGNLALSLFTGSIIRARAIPACGHSAEAADFFQNGEHHRDHAG